MFRIIYFQLLKKKNTLKYEQKFFTKVIKNSYNLYPRIDMCSWHMRSTLLYTCKENMHQHKKKKKKKKKKGLKEPVSYMIDQ
jgi:hypothetical protein